MAPPPKKFSSYFSLVILMRLNTFLLQYTQYYTCRLRASKSVDAFIYIIINKALNPDYSNTDCII